MATRLFALLLLLLCIVLLARDAHAATLVNCPVDCDATPDVAAEIAACLEDQATRCNDEVKVVPINEWPTLLNFTVPIPATPDNQLVSDSDPTEFLWVPTGDTVPRVSCDGLLLYPNTERVGEIYVYLCVQVTFCYIDPEAEVTVTLTGTCDITTLDAPGVTSTAYVGGVVQGCGLAISPYWQTQVYFDGTVFDGQGCTGSLLADCMLNSNLTMNNVTVSGYLGDYVLRAEACDYDVWIDLRDLHIIDAPGTALYFEGIWGLRLYDFLCERCAQRNGSECVHVLMSPASDGVLDIQSPNCFRVADVLPPRCRYCLTGDEGFCGARCDEGEVEVYDRRATEQFANCPLIDFNFVDYFSQTLTNIDEFDPICRVWSPPTCNFISVTNSQNFTQEFPFAGGDIVWFYDAPLICAPGGDVLPLSGPFFLTDFENYFGDPVPPQVLPPLPTPPAFVDPSFEQFGTIWAEEVLSDPPIFVGGIQINPVNPDVITDDAPQPARNGNWLMRCDNEALKRVSQTVTADAADVGNPRTLEFWGRRREGQRFRYASRFMRLLIDGVEQDRIDEPEFSDTLVNDNQYYSFELTWAPADTSPHVLSLECDFRGGSGAVTLHIDDLSLVAPWAGAALEDAGFEAHSLTWTDDPLGGVVLPAIETPCPARTGSHLLHCGVAGELRRATQQVTFTQDGVYAVQFYAQRRNSIGNYAGLEIRVIDDNTVLSTVPIDVEHLPTDDTYYQVVGEGGIIISGAPVVLDLGFQCQFLFPPGGDAHLCIDDVSIVAIGTEGVTPSTLGFSAQVISSAPFIVNQTCDCSNFTAEPRNVTAFPCVYALDNDTICIEEEPSCCATQLVQQSTTLPHVLFGNQSCSDLNQSPPCVLLLDCSTLLAGELIQCREFTCPYNASEPALPAQSVPDLVDYILTQCTENVVGGDVTASLLYPDLVIEYAVGIVQYLPVPNDGLVTFGQVPTAFYRDCPLADDNTCLIYTNCDATIDYDPVTQTYAVYNCDWVNCTAPSGMIPSSQAELAACALISSGNDLSSVDGAWFFRDDGSAYLVVESQLLFYYATYAEYCNQTDYIPVYQLPPAQAVLATACAEPKYFRACPCCPTSGTFTVPEGASNDDPAQTDTFYTCTNSAPSCRCNQPALDASSPPPADTIAYHIVVAPDSLSLYRFIDARAQQYQYGQVLEQPSYELQARNTIAVPHFYDSRARCRLSIRNDNNFCRGSPATGGADCYEGNLRGPYSEACNILNTAGPGPAVPCMMWYGQFAQITSEIQCQCIVDDRATDELAGFGSTVFNTISDALTGCNKDNICVRFSRQSAYFEEDLEITKANRKIVLITLEGAIVVGQHTIGTNADNVTVIGFRFVHPADNKDPLFAIEKAGDASDLNDFTILNCVLDGSGCRKCGVVNTKRLDNMVMNYTQLNDWEFFTVKLDDVEHVTLAHNVFNETIGRTLLIRYEEGFIVDQLSMIGARGGEDLKGAAITSFTAKNNDACDESSPTHRCLFRHVQQMVRTTDEVPRFRDICFYFARGALNAARIYDNACRLAQNGFVFLKTSNIGSPQLVDPLMIFNPLVRPHLFQLRDEPDANTNTFGTDYVIRTTTAQVGSDGDVLFTYNDDIETDYDDPPFLVPIADIRCQSNVNWPLRYGFGESVGGWWWPEPGRPRMGVELFHNVSVLVEFCEDRREVPPVLGGVPALAFIGYVRPFNGSRITPELLSVYRDAWLRGDDTDACCTLPNWPPAMDGVGHRLLTKRLNLTEVAFCMPRRPFPADMWSSGPLEYDADQVEAQAAFTQTLPNEVCMDHVLVDGRHVLPPRAMWAFRLLLGEEVPPEFFEAGTNKLPPLTEALLVVRDSTIRNFLALNSETAPDGFNYVQGEYPHANGLHAMFFNRLETNTEVRISNLTVRDVDNTGLELFFASNITVQNSSFLNCSGRAFGNDACAKLFGNDISGLLINSKKFNATNYFLSVPITLLWQNNTGLHTTDVLQPRDDRAANPGWVAHFQFVGWPNTTDFCVLNGSADGLPLAYRYYDVLNETLLNCSRWTTQPAIVWPDLARYLRAQCMAGGLGYNRGTVDDLALGRPNTDRTGETYFCNSIDSALCCPLLDPSECYVTTNPALLVPGNPWFNVFVFGSLNLAIQNCNATRRQIVVIGSEDIFRTGDFTEKLYTEVISATVPLQWASGASGPLLITATAGVTWRSVGNRLTTQCVQTTVQGFKFEYDVGAGANAVIWDQTAPSDDSCGLRLDSNRFEILDDGWAVRAVAGDHFWVQSNTVRGNGLTRRAIEVTSNGSCTDVGVRVSNNVVTDVTGVGIYVAELNCFNVNNNHLDNVGGQDTTTFIPYSLFVGVCQATPVALSFPCTKIHDNVVRTTQITNALVGLMATCWFDPMPIDIKRISVRSNDCRGLEFGIRFNQMPDSSPSNDPKQQLRQFALDGNVESKGLVLLPLSRRFDLVRGPPADDVSLVNDPNIPANEGRWCTDGCPRANIWIFYSILMAIGACLLLALACFLVTGCCTPRRYTMPLVNIVARYRADTTAGASGSDTTPLLTAYSNSSAFPQPQQQQFGTELRQRRPPPPHHAPTYLVTDVPAAAAVSTTGVEL